MTLHAAHTGSNNTHAATTHVSITHMQQHAKQQPLPRGTFNAKDNHDIKESYKSSSFNKLAINAPKFCPNPPVALYTPKIQLLHNMDLQSMV